MLTCDFSKWDQKQKEKEMPPNYLKSDSATQKTNELSEGNENLQETANTEINGTDNTLLFDSRFESGNLSMATKVASSS